MATLTFIVPLVVAALVSLGLFVLTALNRGKRGAYSMMGFLGGIVVWSGAYALQLSTTTRGAAILWNNVRFFGVAITPVAMLVFALQYTGQRDLVTRRNVALLFVVPVLTNVVIWTNPVHGLWGTYQFTSNTDQLVQLTNSWSPWFLVHTLYSFGAGIAAVAFFAGKWYNLESEAVVTQTSAFLFATLLPMVGSAATVAGIAPLDLAPFAFAISGILIVTAIFKL